MRVKELAEQVITKDLLIKALEENNTDVLNKVSGEDIGQGTGYKSNKDKYEEQGYELDDDTSEYDEEDADNDSFFNNALNDKQTVRIFFFFF